MKRNRGITLIALSVTIIVLLILAGISVATLTGDNGLIANAGKAKEQAEIDGEKEILETSTVQAMGKDKYGNVQQTGLQTALDSNAGNDYSEKYIKLMRTLDFNSIFSYYQGFFGRINNAIIMDLTLK